MIHTLIEAFVLVVIVVFLFLGNVRATLIPLIAVPVSLIGTFAVLLAHGLSRRTPSRCWRWCWRSASSSTTPSWWSRASRRVMEEHPELTPAGGDEEGDGRDHRADHRHHAGAALGLRAARLHPRHLAAQLFRQFAVTVCVSMLISAINALTLSPGALRASC